MMYGSQVLGQIQSKYVNRIIKLQDRAIRVINFASYFASRNQLYIKSRIFKLSDNIQLSNFLLVHSSFNHALPMAFKDTFKPIMEKHKYSTQGAINQHVALPNVRTQIYGIKSVVYQSSQMWNKFVSEFPKDDLPNKSKYVCKKLNKEDFK